MTKASPKPKITPVRLGPISSISSPPSIKITFNSIYAAPGNGRDFLRTLRQGFLGVVSEPPGKAGSMVFSPMSAFENGSAYRIHRDMGIVEITGDSLVRYVEQDSDLSMRLVNLVSPDDLFYKQIVPGV